MSKPIAAGIRQMLFTAITNHAAITSHRNRLGDMLQNCWTVACRDIFAFHHVHANDVPTINASHGQTRRNDANTFVYPAACTWAGTLDGGSLASTAGVQFRSLPDVFQCRPE